MAGNIGRTPADVRLLFAVEEAIAWTTPPVTNADHAGSADAGLDLLIARMEAPLPVSAMDRALTWLRNRPSTTTIFPIPQRHRSNASQATELFLALRFVFLQDNEVLPTVLRTVTDLVTGRPRRVKTHQLATRLRGGSYSFSTYWKAIEADRSAKMAQRGSGVSVSETLQEDLPARRKATELRALPREQMPADALLALQALSNGVRYSFVTP